jgi:hypothetical protein
MFPLPNNATVQQMGSCITYLRRYALAAIVGIVGDEDDDGENDRATRLTPVRDAFKPTQARGAAEVPAKKPAPAATPAQTEPIGDWIAITVKYADEGVAGKNQTPYVKLKDSNGNAYFVWDEQLHGVAKAVQGQTVWIITEASKKADAPPRVTQIRMKPPEPASIAGDIFDEQD